MHTPCSHQTAPHHRPQLLKQFGASATVDVVVRATHISKPIVALLYCPPGTLTNTIWPRALRRRPRPCRHQGTPCINTMHAYSFTNHRTSSINTQPLPVIPDSHSMAMSMSAAMSASNNSDTSTTRCAPTLSTNTATTTTTNQVVLAYGADSNKRLGVPGEVRGDVHKYVCTGMYMFDNTPPPTGPWQRAVGT